MTDVRSHFAIANLAHITLTFPVTQALFHALS